MNDLKGNTGAWNTFADKCSQLTGHVGTATKQIGDVKKLYDIEMAKSDLTGGMCFLLYTGGDEDKLSCVARAACESPVAADNYLAAAKMWYKMHKLIQAVPFSEKYSVIMETLYDASEHAKTGGNCSKYNW